MLDFDVEIPAGAANCLARIGGKLAPGGIMSDYLDCMALQSEHCAAQRDEYPNG